MGSLRVKYQTIEFDGTDIHLKTLRDRQQYFDPDDKAKQLGIDSAQWPLFGVLWDSGNLLAHLMLEHNIENKRILEVGCGVALASHVLNGRNAEITATDHHPETVHFLNDNSTLNEQAIIPFVQTSWADCDSCMGKFDMIIGSDLLYEPNHPQLLADFIDHHAKAQCEIIIIDPGRSNYRLFSKKMIAKGYTHSQSRPSQPIYLKKPFNGLILNYNRLASV